MCLMRSLCRSGYSRLAKRAQMWADEDGAYCLCSQGIVGFTERLRCNHVMETGCTLGQHVYFEDIPITIKPMHSSKLSNYSILCFAMSRSNVARCEIVDSSIQAQPRAYAESGQNWESDIHALEYRALGAFVTRLTSKQFPIVLKCAGYVVT
jgi:hypothetical protein